MYARPFGQPASAPLPQRYDGCAFSASKALPDPPPPPEKKEHFSTVMPSPPQKNPAADFLDFSHGISFDQLLLLGIILLLIGQDGAGEIIPILALLFFCG